MRSNSGKDESRNNLGDGALREPGMDRGTIKPHRDAKAPADHREGQQDKSTKTHHGTR